MKLGGFERKAVAAALGDVGRQPAGGPDELRRASIGRKILDEAQQRTARAEVALTEAQGWLPTQGLRTAERSEAHSLGAVLRSTIAPVA
jgi:hypothetical protein